MRNAIIQMLRQLGLNIAPLKNTAGQRTGLRLEWGQDDLDAVRGTVVFADHLGKPARFFAANDADKIQRHHRRGEFYEMEELAIIGEYFKGGTFVDIGANVGNHTLYALLHLGADRVIAFEPHPTAAAILEVNLLLNERMDRVTLHRCGVADEASMADFKMMANNLGATRLVEGQGVPIAVGDDKLQGERVDFLKIDTEGFELKVLAGLKNVIHEQRPPIFVELDDNNCPAFGALCEEMGYHIVREFRRYPTHINLLAVTR